MYTGTLDVVTPEGVETHQWNGKVEDRDAARAAFEQFQNQGAFLAVVFDSPGKGHQVGSFQELLDHEEKHGTVTAQISTPIVGG